MMSNRFNVLHCDLEDTESIKSVGEVVKARALKGACSYFELETRLAARIVIECNPAFGAQVLILDNEGEIGKVMSSSGVTWHRYLKVERSMDTMGRGLIAHKILAIINAVEEQIPEENVRGYDMIIFYIREGYVPDKDQHHADLMKELTAYLVRKKEGDGAVSEIQRKFLPYVKLKLKPNAAKAYWEELQRLSGYMGSGY